RLPHLIKGLDNECLSAFLGSAGLALKLIQFSCLDKGSMLSATAIVPVVQVDGDDGLLTAPIDTAHAAAKVTMLLERILVSAIFRCHAAPSRERSRPLSSPIARPY